MSIVNFLHSFRRLSVCGRVGNTVVRSVSTDTPLRFQVTPYLCGEPLKKKRKIDPAITRAREERRKRKLEKQIRKLQKNARQLKPVEECEVPLTLMKPDEIKLRQRNLPPLSEAEKDNRSRLIKEWTRYRTKRALADIKMIDRITLSQAKALQELRQESEELYQEAIQIDPAFLPFTAQGPVVTPPINGYKSPDGEYIDISKKWT